MLLYDSNSTEHYNVSVELIITLVEFLDVIYCFHWQDVWFSKSSFSTSNFLMDSV